MKNLTAEKCRDLIQQLKSSRDLYGDLSIKEDYKLQALEIALPVLEQQESKDVFIVVRKPGHLPYIKRPVGDVADYLLQMYQHNPEVSCNVVTYRFPGASGQWVQDGRELLAELEMPQPQPSTTPQIDNDAWIEWGGGESAPVIGMVEVRWSDGSTDTGNARIWRWSHDSLLSGNRLVAYRVIENDGREG